MKHRSILFAALGLAFLVGAAAPASARWHGGGGHGGGGWHGGGWHGGGWRGGWHGEHWGWRGPGWRGPGWYGGYWYGPRAYYAPPPVVYGPPFISVTIP